MGVIAFPGRSAAGPSATSGGSTSLGEAADAFLAGLQAATTRASYAETLGRLVDVAGEDFPVAALTAEIYDQVMGRWSSAAAATWNRHLTALTSFTAWANRTELLETNPARRLQRRKSVRRGDRSIPQARLEKLFTDDKHALRERVLWRMPYETAGRAEEILGLDIEELDLEFRRARVTSKGGAIEYVHWGTATARLLPRLIKGRTLGPVFLADRKAPTAGRRVPAADDIDPATGRGRLSYPRAEYCSNRPLRSWTRTGEGGRCTNCATPHSPTWPSRAAPPPNCRPSPATSTWPASAHTSNSAPRPPPRSPPRPTRCAAAGCVNLTADLGG